MHDLSCINFRDTNWVLHPQSLICFLGVWTWESQGEKGSPYYKETRFSLRCAIYNFCLHPFSGNRIQQAPYCKEGKRCDFQTDLKKF